MVSVMTPVNDTLLSRLAKDEIKLAMWNLLTIEQRLMWHELYTSFGIMVGTIGVDDVYNRLLRTVEVR